MDKQKLISREAIHDLIWTKSMTAAAAELGLSFDALAEVCSKRNIPRPPIGYWTRKHMGRPLPERTPLPLEATEEAPIALPAPAHRPGKVAEPIEAFDEDIMRILAKAKTLPSIIVDPTLRDPHPLVMATQRYTGSMWGVSAAQRRKGDLPLSISVSTALKPRALAIWNALAKAIDRIGGQMIVDLVNPHWGYKTFSAILFAGEKATNLRIREYNRVVIPKEGSPDYRGGGSLYVPTGRLCVDNSPSHFEAKALCQDRGNVKVEEQLNRLLILLVEMAGRNRIERLRAEEARRIREAEEKVEAERKTELKRRQDELRAKQDAERQRVDGLMRDAMAWYRSQILRDYIDAAWKNQHGSPSNDRRENGVVWRKWANDQADRLDPLCPSMPESILDEPLLEV